jgi:hypothetical protein
MDQGRKSSKRRSFVLQSILGLGLLLTSGASAASEWYSARRLNSVLIYTAAKTGPLLSIECESGTLSVLVFWRQPMAGQFTQAITYTIDEQRPRVEQWRISTDRHSVGLWGPGARQMAHRLMGKRRLGITASSRRGTIDAKFDIAGIERALQTIAPACRLPR